MEKISSKCKNCGGDLVYNAEKGFLTCKYCETNFHLPKQNNDAYIVRQYSGDFHPNELNQQLTAYKCKFCDNVYYMSSEETSKKCPNCGNNSSEIISDSGYCADGIIPFSISKEEAAKNMVQYLKLKSNIPSKLKKMAKDQKLMGIYVPVWNFIFNIYSSYSASVTQIKTDSSGSYYGIQVPIFNEKLTRVKSYDQCATDVENDELLKLFDEKDYAKIIPYSPEYTFGYRVDAVNRDIHEYYYETIEKSQNEENQKIKKFIYSKYKEVTGLNIDSQIQDVFFNFTYVPVYINTYTYKNKTYKTYISGTSGKVSGKSPTSFWSKVKIFLKTIGFIAILGLVGYLLIK